MNKLMMVVLVATMLFVTACDEPQQRSQHPVTIQQMQQIKVWSDTVSKEMQILRNNQLFLKNNMFDPNEVVLLKELVE